MPPLPYKLPENEAGKQGRGGFYIDLYLLRLLA